MNNRKTYDRLLQRMQETYTQHTGAIADDASDIGIRFKVLAKEVEELLEQLAELEKQAFPQTAEGKELELHAMQRGLQRKGAVASRGTVVFLRSQPAEREIVVPAGTVVAVAGTPGTSYATVKEAVMPKGSTEVETEIYCQQPGPGGNAAAGAVRTMATPVAGIQSVTNRSPITGGTEAEQDEALRQRLLDTYININNGTNGAFYRSFALAWDEVASANVIPRARGVGTVDVVVYGPAIDSSLVLAMQEKVQQIKEINVDVQVQQAQYRPVDVVLHIAPTKDTSAQDLKERCRLRVSRFFESLGVGQPAVLTHLGRTLMEENGLYNYRLETPVADVIPNQRQKVVLGTLDIKMMQQEAAI